MMNFLLIIFSFALLSEGRTKASESTNSSNLVTGEQKIIGGVRVELYKLPFNVKVSIEKLGKKYTCGGSIYNKRTIVTAAHCLDGCTRRDEVFIWAGREDFSRQPSKYSQKIHAKSWRMHESYKDLYPNDIALLFLEKSLRYSRYVKPIKMADRNEVSQVRSCSLMGWGRTSDNGKSSPHLRMVTAPIVSPRYCQYARHFNPTLQLCISNRGKTVCNGDSGSPAVVYFGRCAKQIGIPALMQPEGCSLGKTIFTNVGYFSHWVTKHAGLSDAKC